MRITLHNLPSLALWIFAAGIFSAAAGERTFTLPEGTRLALPTNSGIRVTTILPLALTTTNRPPFDVDNRGHPWFGYSRRILANPLQGAAAEVDIPYQDFAWLSTGELMIAADGSVGILAMDTADIPKDTNSLPVFRYTPIFRISERQFTLFPGAGGILYLLGKTESGVSEIYQLGKTGEVGTVRHLLSTVKPVSSIAGDGADTYLASGHSVVKISRKGAKLEAVFAHPSEAIRQLEYEPGTGLFYSTENRVGYLSSNGQAVEFLQSRHPCIRLRNQSLYVLLGTSCAVLRLYPVNRFGTLTGE